MDYPRDHSTAITAHFFWYTNVIYSLGENYETNDKNYHCKIIKLPISKKSYDIHSFSPFKDPVSDNMIKPVFMCNNPLSYSRQSIDYLIFCEYVDIPSKLEKTEKEGEIFKKSQTKLDKLKEKVYKNKDNFILLESVSNRVTSITKLVLEMFDKFAYARLPILEIYYKKDSTKIYFKFYPENNELHFVMEVILYLYNEMEKTVHFYLD